MCNAGVLRVFFFFFFFIIPTGRVWLLRSFWQSIQEEPWVVVHVEIEPRVPLLVRVVQHVVNLSSPLFCALDLSCPVQLYLASTIQRRIKSGEQPFPIRKGTSLKVSSSFIDFFQKLTSCLLATTLVGKRRHHR